VNAGEEVFTVIPGQGIAGRARNDTLRDSVIARNGETKQSRNNQQIWIASPQAARNDADSLFVIARSEATKQSSNNLPSGLLRLTARNDAVVIGKALLPIARSGKVKVGQKVNIRLENFPDNEFGILRGVVKNISLVPSQTGQTVNYTVEIGLPEGLTTTYKKELPYLQNMRGKAEIITEDISLLERFVLPVKKILSESL